MQLSGLKLKNFRNFENAEFLFESGRTVVRGENGRGKSNLLEAVYFLAIGKSGRGARDQEVLRWGAEAFDIDAVTLQDDRPVHLRIAYDKRAGKKKAFLQATPLQRLSALVGAFNAVLFSPEDVDLVLRDPPQRRRLLDILVSQSNSVYLADLEQYRRVLSQRNKLLRSLGEFAARNAAQLAPWDAQLCGLGGRIVRQRLDALDEVSPLLEQYYREIATCPERLSLSYRGPIASEDRSGGEDLLKKALASRCEEEALLGYTLVGPHRDQLLFQLEGRPAHKFASKGQLKSVLLAWKLAEATYLERQTGRQPVLLMDDIFSELDLKRAEGVLDLVGGFKQVFLTSARDPDLSLDSGAFQTVDL